MMPGALPGTDKSVIFFNWEDTGAQRQINADLANCTPEQIPSRDFLDRLEVFSQSVPTLTQPQRDDIQKQVWWNRAHLLEGQDMKLAISILLKSLAETFRTDDAPLKQFLAGEQTYIESLGLPVESSQLTPR